MAGVVITTLPANGSLRLNGMAIPAGTYVTAAQLANGELVWRPPANANGAGLGSFTFQVRDAGGTAHTGGTLITVEGPRFSTKAESNAFRAWGCDIIGMTASPEAFLAREAEIDFAIMAHVTDYDVWHEEEEAVTVDMVIQRLHANLALAQQAIARLAASIPGLPHETEGAMKYAVMTTADRISPAARERLGPLVGRYLS